MKTSKNILQPFNTDNKETLISSGKLFSTIVVIVTLIGIAFLLPSCLVGLKTSGNERRGGNTTEQHDGGERHDNNGHDNDKNHNRDNHRK